MSHQNGLNVLVVEDCLEDAIALRNLLLSDGHKVRIAPYGEAALVEMLADAPDVMLLDLDLPNLDGLEVAAATREMEWSQRPLLMAVTGPGERLVRDQATAAGIDLYLVKPVDPGYLCSVLRMFYERIARSSSGRSSSRSVHGRKPSKDRLPHLRVFRPPHNPN